VRKRNTLILAVLAVLLAAWFFLVETPRQRNAERESISKSDLAEFDIQDVSFVSIERPDGRLEFERENRGWKMTAPLTDWAEDGAVNQLLGIVADGEIFRDLGPQDDLSPFGLSRPAAVITAVLAGGDTVAALAIGKLTVDTYYAYARPLSPGGHVLLVPTGIRRYALASQSEFRNNRLVSFGMSTVSGFTIRWPDRSLEWQRADSGGWITRTGSHAVTGRTQYVEAVLRYLQGVRVAEFVPSDQVPLVAPFESPVRSVNVTIEDGSTHVVTFGRRLETRLYAGARYTGADDKSIERVVLCDTTVLQIFESTLDNMRDRRLLRMNETQVHRFEIVSPEFNLTLVRPGNEWGYPNPSMGTPDPSKVSRAIAIAGELEYDRVIDEDSSAFVSYGLSNPAIRFTIYDAAGSSIDELVCGNSNEYPDFYITHSLSSAVVSVIEKEQINSFIERFKNLQDP
jgi:hypothetical protein